MRGGDKSGSIPTAINVRAHIILAMDVQTLSSRILRFAGEATTFVCKVCRRPFSLQHIIEHSLTSHYYQCYSAVHCAACDKAFFVPFQSTTIFGRQLKEAREVYIRMFIVHATICLLRCNQQAVTLFCETMRGYGLINDISGENTSLDRSLMEPGVLKAFPIAPDAKTDKEKETKCNYCTIM